MKKEFSFTLALTVALCLHVLLAVFMKYNPLAASPATPSSAMNSPVTMQFVEVPQNATASTEPVPSSKYASDANRKAGPLIPNKVRQPTPQIRQYPSFKGQSARSAPAAPSTSTPAQQPSASEPSGESKAVPEPGREMFLYQNLLKVHLKIWIASSVKAIQEIQEAAMARQIRMVQCQPAIPVLVFFLIRRVMILDPGEIMLLELLEEIGLSLLRQNLD